MPSKYVGGAFVGLTAPPTIDHPMTQRRRSKRRFPLRAEVRFTVRSGGKQMTGRGWIVNLSSQGALLQSGQPVPPGKLIELSIAWPLDLGNSAGLRLWVRGRTVRAENECTAIKFKHYEFRVQPLAQKAAP